MQSIRFGALSPWFRLWSVSFLILFLAVNNNCGGGGGDDDDDDDEGTDAGLGIEASVATPSLTGSLSVPHSARMASSPRVEETTAEGIPVHAEDLSGTEIGTSCTTDAEGTCTVTGLTQAQIETGCTLVYEFTNDAGNVTEVHAPVFLSTEEVAQVVAGETVTEEVNTKTDNRKRDKRILVT